MATRLRLALLSLLLFECGKPRKLDCEDALRCFRGATLASWWTCDALARAEDIVIESYVENSSWNPIRTGGRDFACKQLGRYEVAVVPSETFELSYFGGAPITVFGATDCDFGVIQIGNGEAKHSALWHEVGHALTFCTNQAPCAEGEDATHCGWELLGFSSAEANARLFTF